MAERCIRTHCTRDVGALKRPHHALSCGSPECEMFARGYEAGQSATPPKCDPMVFSKGSPIGMLTGPARAIESIVVAARTESGVKIDWHYMGGRGVVLAIGGEDERRRAFDALKHNRVRFAGLDEFSGQEESLS